MLQKLTLFLLLFFTFSLLFKSDQAFEQDLGRHLKLGEIIIRTHQIPKTNLFSYTNPDFAVIDHHWLFQVLVYLGEQTLGIQAVLIFKLLILLLAVFLTIKLCTTYNTPYLLLPVGFFFLHVLRERIDLRPEIFSFLFTALTLWILEKFSLQPSRLKHKLYLLPLIQLVWVNTHIYFPLGLLLQGIFLLDLIWQRSWVQAKTLSIILLISSLTTLINPNFIRGTLYPFAILGSYGYTIVENQTIFFLDKIGFKDPNILFSKIAWGIATLAILLALLKRKLDIKGLGLISLGVGLSLTNVRSIPYLIFISLPTTVSYLRLLPKFIKPLLVWISLLLIPILLIESILYLNNWYYLRTDSKFKASLQIPQTGRSALDFVNRNHLTGPIFNNFDIGSYIIYRSYPNLRVFVDGRPESYPKEFFTDIYIPMQYDYSKFSDWDQKLNFQTIIFSHTDQTPWAKTFLKTIKQDKKWKLTYLDEMFVIFVKEDNPSARNLPAVNLKDLTPDVYQYKNHTSYLYISLYLLNIGQTVPAKMFAKRAYQLNPNSPVANSILFALEPFNFDLKQKIHNRVFW